MTPAPDSDAVTAATSDHAARADLIARYAAGAEVLRSAIAGLPADALRARPIAGKMSSLEVVAHVVDADQYMCDRMKRTIATERPLLMGVESVDYLEPLHYQDRGVELDIRMLEVQRDQMLADLKRLPELAWERSAVHSEVGLLTLRQLLAHATVHLESHVSAIAEKRAALGL